MNSKQVPEAGDIVLIDFDPQAGREIQKRRPALVLSPLAFNRAIGLAWICPITSTPPKHGFQVELPRDLVGFSPLGEGVSTVKIEQLRSLDFRAQNAVRIATVPKEFLNKCRSYAERILQG